MRRKIKASWGNVYLYNKETKKSILCKNIQDAEEQRDLMKLEQAKWKRK